MLRISLLFTCIIIAAISNAQTASLPKSDGIDYVDTEENGITIETRIVLEKEAEKTKIIFWQETSNGFIFKNVNWKGDVGLVLDNGETLVLPDNKMKGHLMERGGHMNGVFVPDIYQRYAAFYLTEEQCNRLKQHYVALIKYSLDDKYDKETHYLEVSDQKQSLKSQLTAIGK